MNTFSSPLHEVYPACRVLLYIVRDAQGKAGDYVQGYSRNTVTPKDWCKEGANLFSNSGAAEVALDSLFLKVLAENLRQPSMKAVIATADFVSDQRGDMKLIFCQPLEFQEST